LTVETRIWSVDLQNPGIISPFHPSFSHHFGKV
jgi:hypothetical protein